MPDEYVPNVTRIADLSVLTSSPIDRKISKRFLEYCEEIAGRLPGDCSSLLRPLVYQQTLSRYLFSCFLLQSLVAEFRKRRAVAGSDFDQAL